ncbi:MAG: ATP-binding protein [Minicystis sp.]
MSPPAPAAPPDSTFGGDAAATEPDETSGWASLRRPRLGVFLSAPLASPAQVKDRWLVQLRWLALAGMTATVITARMLVPGLRILPLLLVLGAVLATNLAWARLVRRAREQGSGDQRARQILFDAVLLTALLWFSGGLHNPFAFFLTFQIALAGALCDGRTTARVGLVAGVSTAVLAFAPRLPLEGAPLGAAVVEMLGRLAAIVSLGLFLGAFAVVYARKLTELREASERNQRLAMLGRLVGGMSHELATPLGTILLGSRDLCALTRDDPETAELASTIAAEAERATDIIGLLRGHIRPDQRAETVDLSTVVPQIVGRELDRLGFTGARVLSAPDVVPAAVLRVGLAQVLRNLLANAVHATGEVRPAGEGRIEVAVSARGESAEVSITDNGPGFSPEIVERLGEPFQTTKEEGEGLGLGLYVSTVLARQMNATLRAENAEGGGARVTLTLELGAIPSKPGCDIEPARTETAS